MFRSCISILLIFCLAIPSSFAQSSPQSEVDELQRCMDQRFKVLNDQLSKEEGHPVVLNSEARLKYSKFILSALVIGFDQGMQNLKSSGMWCAFFSIVASLSVYALYTRNLKAKANLDLLEQQFKTLRLNAAELAQAGGEETYIAKREAFKLISRNAVRFSWVFGAVTLLTGFFAYLCLKSLLENKEVYENASGDLDLLMYAKSEHDFNRYLGSSNPFVSEIRAHALNACKLVNNNDLKNILDLPASLDKLTIQDTIQRIQEQLDTLSQE